MHTHTRSTTDIAHTPRCPQCNWEYQQRFCQIRIPKSSRTMTNMASQAAPSLPSLSYCRNTLRAKWLFREVGRGAGTKVLVYYANAASLWLRTRTSLCVPHIWVLSELSGITTNWAQKILHEFAWAAHKAKQVTSWRADWWTDCANKQKMHSKKRKGGERGGRAHNSTRAQSVELTIAI